jgi:hypothetical protein
MRIEFERNPPMVGEVSPAHNRMSNPYHQHAPSPHHGEEEKQKLTPGGGGGNPFMSQQSIKPVPLK